MTKTKNILKARRHRKRVKLEKARLRRRGKKSKRTEYVTMYIDWDSLAEQTRVYLTARAKKEHCSVSKVIRKILKEYLMKDWEALNNGIQKKPNKCMDESSEK